MASSSSTQAHAPGVTTLVTASQVAVPGSGSLTLGQFASDPVNYQPILDRARSSKKNDVVVAYCKALKAIWALEALLQSQRQTVGQLVPQAHLPPNTPACTAVVLHHNPVPSSSKVKGVNPNDPMVVQLPSALEPLPWQQRASHRWKSFHTSVSNSAYIIRVLLILMCLFVAFMPALTIRLASAWLRAVITTLWNEWFQSVYDLAAYLCVPLAQPFKDAAQYVNALAPDDGGGASVAATALTLVAMALGRALH